MVSVMKPNMRPVEKEGQMITSISTKVVIKMCSNADGELRGEIYHVFSDTYFYFKNPYEMLIILEDLFDNLAFPQASVQYRSFSKRTTRAMVEKDRVLLGHNQSRELLGAKKIKFVLHVQYRQNATWQGEVNWVKQNQTRRFRSALELLKLMDEAFDTMDEG